MLKITGTFLDEMSHDIPSQNWGEEEWDKDFEAMKEIGIDTVIIIRPGLRNQCIFSSKVLNIEVEQDLAKMFLEKAEKYGMKLFFGTYDSGYYWAKGLWKEDVAINLKFIDEVWKKYGHYKSFYGWYLSQEVCKNEVNITHMYNALGEKCKKLTPDKPVLISPFFRGKKSDIVFTAEETQKIWDDLLSDIKYIDMAAFQDGSVPTPELPEYWKRMKEVFNRHKIKLWCNTETFSRDLHTAFPTLDIRDLIAKLKAATPYVEKVITFEFSHFMSPNSSYISARNLYKRYGEYIGKDKNGSMVKVLKGLLQKP